MTAASVFPSPVCISTMCPSSKASAARTCSSNGLRPRTRQDASRANANSAARTDSRAMPTASPLGFAEPRHGSAEPKSGLNLDTKLTRACLEFLVGELTDFVLATIDFGDRLVVGAQVKRDRRALKMSETLTPPDGIRHTLMLAAGYRHDSSCTQSEATH